MGGGHIPQNNVIESKLDLLKEMIRKSIEKRPQSADPVQKPQRTFQHFPKNPANRDILPSIKQEKSQIEPLEDIDQEVLPLFQHEKALINSILTIKSQQETKEHFFNNLEKPKPENFHSPEKQDAFPSPENPKKEKNSLIRPPQNFENTMYQQISNRLDAELLKIPQIPMSE